MASLIFEYTFSMCLKKAIKGSTITEFLADRTENEYEPMKFEFSDENLMTIFQVEDESIK